MKRSLGQIAVLLVLCAGCRARIQAVGSSASAPSALSFGDASVGQSKSLKLQVTNESNEELSLDIEVSAPFSVSSPPASVPAGGNVSLEVVFAPADGQNYDQTLTLRLSATDTPTLPVQLTGNGLALSGGSECGASHCSGTCCGDQCVADTQSDPAHCGGCSPCDDGQTCVSGVCTAPTPGRCSAANCNDASHACCSDACVDTTTADHCGGCNPCAASQTCIAGACVTPSTGGACDDLTNPCPGGQKCCNHACTAVGPNGICPCNGPGGLTTFDTGTIIIPMDACYQRGSDVATLPSHCYVNNSETTGSDAPLKAYGLVFFLLRHQVTVYMGINPNKTSIDDVDLSIGSFLTHITPVQKYDWATATVGPFPDTTQNTVSYRGAPFIIDSTQHDRVLDLLKNDPDFQQFRDQGNISVHVAGKPFQTAIAKSISTVPSRIALLYATAGSEVTTDILVRYLASAGLNFAGAGGTPAAPGAIYDVLHESDLGPDYNSSALKTGGYKMLWAPHWEGGTADTATALASIGAFVNAGNDLFAECAAIGTLEGFSSSRFNAAGSTATRFMTSTGMAGNDISTGRGGDTGPFTYGGLTSPFAQRGDFTFVGFSGAITDFQPGTGSLYFSDVVRHITANSTGTDLLTSLDQHSSGKGTVVYLAGHDYSYTSGNRTTLGITAGSRLVLNTLFSLGENNICQ